MDQWSVRDVGDWLSSIGYEQYRYSFEILKIDGPTLAKIDANDLRRMGVKGWKESCAIAYKAMEMTGRHKLTAEQIATYESLPFKLKADPTPFRRQDDQPLGPTKDLREVNRSSGLTTRTVYTDFRGDETYYRDVVDDGKH